MLNPSIKGAVNSKLSKEELDSLREKTV